MMTRERRKKLDALNAARITEPLRLARLRRFAAANKRRKRLPRMLQPDMIRLEYSKGIRDYVRRARAIIQLGLLPYLPVMIEDAAGERRSDTASKDASDLIDTLAREFVNSSDNARLENLAGSMASRTSIFSKAQLGNVLTAAVGVDPQNVFNEPNIPPMIEQFTTENVALIKSIPERYFSDVRKVVLSGLADGDRMDEMSEEIEGRFGVAQSSADLIARDQIGKFYGDLNDARQTELGITSYIWRTSEDERVRDEHDALNGEEFDWDDDPDEGHPGEAINCRCHAEPVIDDILGDL